MTFGALSSSSSAVVEGTKATSAINTSIPEAISLILLSLGLKKDNNIFILDMGKPIKIFDIAKRLCQIYNKNLVKEKKTLNDVEYIVTGLKYGEKLVKKLLDVAKEKKCYRVDLNCNKELDHFYEKNGFGINNICMNVYFKENFK